MSNWRWNIPGHLPLDVICFWKLSFPRLSYRTFGLRFPAVLRSQLSSFKRKRCVAWHASLQTLLEVAPLGTRPQFKTKLGIFLKLFFFCRATTLTNARHFRGYSYLVYYFLLFLSAFYKSSHKFKPGSLSPGTNKAATSRILVGVVYFRAWKGSLKFFSSSFFQH